MIGACPVSRRVFAPLTSRRPTYLRRVQQGIPLSANELPIDLTTSFAQRVGGRVRLVLGAPQPPPADARELRLTSRKGSVVVPFEVADGNVMEGHIPADELPPGVSRLALIASGRPIALGSAAGRQSPPAGGTPSRLHTQHADGTAQAEEPRDSGAFHRHEAEDSAHGREDVGHRARRIARPGSGQRATGPGPRRATGAGLETRSCIPGDRRCEARLCGLSQVCCGRGSRPALRVTL